MYNLIKNKFIKQSWIKLINRQAKMVHKKHALLDLQVNI